MRRFFFLFLLAATLLSAQITITVANGSPARLVRPGSSETIAFEVRLAGQPLPNAELLLSAPLTGASGTFPASPNAPDQLAVRTNSAGLATANFTLNATPGWFRVDGRLQSPNDAEASIAFTSLPNPPTTANDPATARAQLLRTDPLLSAPNTVLHGPWLLPAGVSVEEAIGASRGLPLYPAGATWFFWLDRDPQASFGHRVSYITFDAASPSQSAAPLSKGWRASWWPIIKQGSTSHALAPSLGFTIRPTSAFKLTSLRLAEPDPTSCAILFMGTGNPAARGTLDIWEGWLVRSGTVAQRNIFQLMGPSGREAASPEWLERAVKDAVDRGCKKVYLIGHSHGAPSEDGAGLGLAPDAKHPNGLLPYPEFVNILKPLKDEAKLCILLQACFSGQFGAALTGAGFKGILFTDADSFTESYNVGYSGGALSLAAVGKLIKFPELNFEGAIQKVLAEPDASLKEVLKDGLPLSDGTRTGERRLDADTYISRSSPLSFSLADGFVGVSLIDLFLPRPNATATFPIEVASKTASDRPAYAVLSARPPFIADFPDAGRNLFFNGVTTLRSSVRARNAGESTYAVEAVDLAARRATSVARVRVGNFTVSTRTIIIPVGGTSNVSIRLLDPVTYSRSGTLRSTQSEQRQLKVANNNPRIATTSDLGLSANFQTSDFRVTGLAPGATTLVVYEENDPQCLQTITVIVTPAGASSENCAGVYEGPLRWDVLSGSVHIPFTNSPLMTSVRLTLDGRTGSLVGGAAQYPNATGVMTCAPTSSNGTLTGVSPVPIANRANVPVQYAVRTTFPPPAPGSNTASQRQAASATVDITMTLGDGVFPNEPLVMQARGTLRGGSLCAFQLSPPAILTTSEAGQATVEVIANAPTCAWSVTSNNPFATLGTTRSGSGNGSFIVSWTANTGPARSANLSLDALTLRVDQSGPTAERPAVAAVVSDGSFASGYVPGSWIAILGSNLSRSTRTWTGSDFTGTRLPESLDGVQVVINGRRAYPYFVSPNQVNVLAPDDPTLGDVELTVTNANGSSQPISVSARSEVAPALFALNAQYPAATHPDGALVGRPGLIPGGNFRPARSGAPIVVYGTGFGPTTPDSPAALVVTGAPRTSSPVTASIGGVEAPVQFAGKISSGLYQFNLLVPSLPNGDHALVLRIRGGRTLQTLSITVENE